MALFTTTNLMGSRVLVEGEDRNGVTGSTVVSSAEWERVNSHSEFSQAEADFDAAVDRVFGDIMAAAEKLEQSVKVPARPTDSASYVVLHEGQEAVEGKDEIIVLLSRDSIILRLIADDDHDRLVWVNDELEIIESDEETVPVNGAGESDVNVSNFSD